MTEQETHTQERQRGKRLKPFQIRRILELRESGKSFGQIARIIKCSVGAVSFQCLKGGADHPNARPLPATPKGPMVVNRGAFVVRKFTPEEDAQILALEQEGKSTREIALALGRKWNSTQGRQMILARREERALRFSSIVPDGAAVTEACAHG